MKKILWVTGTALLLAARLEAADTTGEVLMAGQAVQGDTASSKFEEYEDIPRGFYVERLGFNTRGTTYYFDIQGDKPGLKDQRVDVMAGQWGLHKIELSYNQTPHNFSNTAQSYLQDQGNGVLTLPDSLQSSLQTSTNNAAGFFSNTPAVPLRLDRKRGDLTYQFNPTGAWRMNFGYTGEKKEGVKAIGIAFGHDQLEEAMEPIQYQTHDVHIGTEFSGKDTGFSADYRFSYFLDELKSLTADNPVRLADASVSASGSSTPGKVRLALPPSNLSHLINVAFTRKLPAKSRLTFNGEYNLQTQNDDFLPLTSNQAILNDPRLPALPANSLQGRVDTWNARLKWNWKPADKVSVNANGQNYQTHNKTPSLLFSQYVPYDASFSTGTPTSTYNPSRSRQNLPLDYNKTDAGLDANYFMARWASLKLAYNWEQYLRDFRESTKTTENIYTAALTLRASSRFVIRPNYVYARRSVFDYDAERVAEEMFPLGEGTSLGQLPELRKYDQSSRERNKMGLRLDWDMTDALNLGVDAGYTRDAFVANYGLLKQKSIYYSADLGYNTSERSNVYAGYTWERGTDDTRSRYRVTGLDTPANDWVGQLDDLVQTINAGFFFDWIKDRLQSDIGYTMSYAKGVQQAYNPNTLQGSASQIAAATATDLPNTYNRLHELRAAFRYKWTEQITARFQYEYRRYTETDWTQDTLDVYQATWNKSVFLGATQPGYEAHLFSLALAYLFL